MVPPPATTLGARGPAWELEEVRVSGTRHASAAYPAPQNARRQKPLPNGSDRTW